MIKLYKTPTNAQLMSIANFINEELKDTKKDNISIQFELDLETFRKIDEEYFFKNNKEAKTTDFIPGDEVQLNMSGIKFNFIKIQ